jgi:hypothetical protein
VQGSCGLPFALVELKDRSALEQCQSAAASDPCWAAVKQVRATHTRDTPPACAFVPRVDRQQMQMPP